MPWHTLAVGNEYLPALSSHLLRIRGLERERWMAAGGHDANLARLLLTRRLKGFAEGTALAALPSLASMMVLLAVYAPHASLPLTIAWSAAFGVLLAARIYLARVLKPEQKDLRQLDRQFRLVQHTLMMLSLFWGISLPLAAWLGQGREQGAFALVGAAGLGGVLLMHRALPAVARFHVVAIGAGLAAGEIMVGGWQAWPSLILIALYMAPLIVAIGIDNRHFVTACTDEFRRHESEQTVSMLLNDHESQAADWLWTVGPGGVLSDVSERLAAVLHLPVDAVEDLDFLSLIEPGRERERIAEFFAAKSAFRDEPVPVSIDGARRFWRLSGHPRADGQMTGVGRDVTDQQQIEERVRTMAYVDPLTGLANRHLFNQRLREMLGEEGSDAKPVALLYLDLDDFKAVNDVQGHIFGDSLLREMGARLRRESRETDLVARLGGDEFAVIVGTAAGDGMLIERAHRLLAAAREPFQIEGQSALVSTSVGIARAGRDCDAAELMRRVDLALYAAKAKGRDRMAIFDEALDRRARERRELELQLREAIGRGEMVLHYQPVISLENGATVGYEALVRWQHPVRGLLLPDQFLGIAEETGLIIGLGDWVIRRALADVAEWPGDFRLALNLSPSQFRSANLIATIESAIAASGFAASRLEFEITEHVLLADAEAGGSILDRLRALGAEIALDDFGTGYSSLSYLRRFRFERVKIDRTFVRDLETSDEARAIVSAVTRLAQALGMRTTAEGVEQPGQLDLLRKLGCDEAQGFLILEPVEARQIQAARMRGDDLPVAGAEMEDYREARRAALARPGPRSA